MPVTLQTATLKYKNSRGEFQTADCLKGSPADVIDDSAGAGETGKTWSADKLISEFASKGKDVFLVTITSEEVSGETVYHADKTFAQIKEAVLAGMEVMAVEHFSGETDYHNYCRIAYAATSNDYPNTEVIQFVSNTSGESWSYMFYPNGNIEQITENVIDDESGNGDTDRTWSADKLANEFSVLEPAATSSDVGKFLKAKTVSNGKVTEYEFGEDGSENVASDKAPVIVNNASGPIASFNDGAEMPVRDCVVSIEPVQDLHGQDSLYLAGEGVNKIAWNDGIDFTLNNVRYYVSGGKLYLDGTSTGETSSLDNTFKTYFSFTLPAGTYYFTKGSYSNPVACLVHDVNGTSTRRVSNSGPFTLTEAETVWVGFSVSDNKTFSNTEAPIQIVSGSSAPTAYSPYSNIFCPITGWTGVTAYRTGKNLLPMPIESGSYANTMSIAVNQDKSFYVTKTSASGWTTLDLCRNYYLPAGTYTFIHSDDGSQNSSCTITNAKTSESITNTRYAKTRTLTFNEGVYLNINYSRSAMADNVLTKLMLFEGTTATETDYVPYSGTTIPVVFPAEAGTVYGGQLDVTTGTLAVDRATITLDGTQAINNSSFSNTYNIVARWVIPDTKQYDSQQFPNAVCDKLKVTNSGKAGNFAAWGNDSNAGYTFTTFKGSVLSYAAIGLPVSLGITTNAGLNAWLSTNPITICYELAEPLTYQLTPVQILTLLGQNNLWADTGDIAVDYCADTKTYVDQNEGVKDVQINGTSILSDGVANVPWASSSNLGVVGVSGNGLTLTSSNYLAIQRGTDSEIKAGTNAYKPIVPTSQHQSVFYGLAKLAGADMASSSNAVGTYTETAKIKIHDMLEPQFRLIKEITTTEGQTEVYVNSDSLENPFELTEMIIDIKMTIPSGSGNGVLLVNQDSKIPAYQANALMYDTIPTLICSNLFNTSGLRRNIQHLEIKGGRFFGTTEDGAMTSWNLGGSLRRNVASSGIIEVDKIRSILLYENNGASFGTNSVIKVYGR